MDGVEWKQSRGRKRGTKVTQIRYQSDQPQALEQKRNGSNERTTISSIGCPIQAPFFRQIHKRRMKKEVGRVLRCDRRSQRARCQSCKSKCPLYFLQRCRTAGAAARGGAFWLLARSERGGRALKSVNDRGSKWKRAPERVST